MTTVKRHDWGLIVSGILLILLAGVISAYPGLTMATITIIVGIGFLISATFSLVCYVRLSAFAHPSGWMLAYAVLDFILGMMFILQPVLLSAVISWLVGTFVACFGIFEIVAAVQVRKAGVKNWGWLIFSGVMDILCGIVFFVWPDMLALFIAVFIIMRGITLIIYGWQLETVLL